MILPQQEPILHAKLTEEGRHALLAACEIIDTLDGPVRALDRTLAVFFGQDDFLNAPSLTGSLDAVLQRIEIVFPRWTHGYQWFPQAVVDQKVEARGWIGGPGYISDDYEGDYFDGEAATPALAMLKALLNAIINDGLKVVA